MKTSSIALLVLYYCLGCCHGYRDIHKRHRSLLKKSWRDQNRFGSKRDNPPDIGRLNFALTPPATKTVSVGESFRLFCNVDSIPYANIYWKKDGVRIIQGSRYSINDYMPMSEEQAVAANRPIIRLSSQTSRLYIDCFTPDKAGVYECVAESSSRRISHKTLVRTTCPVTDPTFYAAGFLFRLLNHVLCTGDLSGNVDTQCLITKKNARREPARIYLFTTYRIEMANSTVQLVCRAEGNPHPTITWYKNNRNAIGPNTPGYRLLSNGDLVLESWYLRSHFHSFFCEAENRYGTDSVESYVYLTAADRN